MLESIFREHLDGEPLLTNNFVKWSNFPLVRNRRWYSDRLVLLGDALHTAHFSIGSGTKLALEDAIALAQAFRTDPDPGAALPLFEAARRPRVEQLQEAAVDSLRWFEEMGSRMHLAPLPFAVEAMTRSKRIDVEKLRQRDPAFVDAYVRWSSEQGGS
jgi:anthraniloyl-CoA monooxygenase